MNINDLYPSRYLKAGDFDEPQLLRISSLVTEKMNDGQDKPVLYFGNSPKGLVLNRTNANVLQELYGADTDAWEGKEIKLIASSTDFQGRAVDCIRLRPPAKKVAKKVAAPASEPSLDDLDDKIPF